MKVVKWIMKTPCKHCGKTHEVKGRRRDLEKLMDERIEQCRIKLKERE